MRLKEEIAVVVVDSKSRLMKKKEASSLLLLLWWSSLSTRLPGSSWGRKKGVRILLPLLAEDPINKKKTKFDDLFMRGMGLIGCLEMGRLEMG